MIKVNGKPADVLPGPLAQVLPPLLAGAGLDAAARGIAVALNGAVVSRGRWADVAVADGDTLEIVKVLQGG